MKRHPLFFLLLLFMASTSVSSAQCGTAEHELVLTINCAPEDCAFTFKVNDLTYTTSAYVSTLILSQGVNTYCIPTCTNYELTYNNENLPENASFTLYLDGTLMAGGDIDGYYYAGTLLDCSDGSTCNEQILIQDAGSYTGTGENTWYNFIPEQTGVWEISTCGLNTCDTRIWVYESCPWTLFEGPEGTYAYNDDYCGEQASLLVEMEDYTSYNLRIGDNGNNCTDAINFTITYIGPIDDCTDPTACNYNPLAAIDDGSCIYFPDPNCGMPDLVVNTEILISAMEMMVVESTSCDVEEGMVTGDGQRSVLTFSVRIDNIGGEDYYIGNPEDNPEMFDVQNCHNHVHYAGYGDYRLMDMDGNIIPAGHKNGFCVMDLCGSGQYTCGEMGISAGCYDQYGAGTQGQWFDLTDVPDGHYYGLVTVNPLELPDALGREEMNYENNTYVFCMAVDTDSDGNRTCMLLGDGGCEPYIDCAGVENGTSTPDCNGVCDGPSIWGDVVSDNDVNNADVSEYIDYLTQEVIEVTTCNDISANGTINIYDLSLAYTCSEESALGGTTACTFPHDVLSSSGTCELAISNANFEEGYVEIEMTSTYYHVTAFQFIISGIEITDVQNLMPDFTGTMSFNAYDNSVFGITEMYPVIFAQSTPRQLCRVYFNQVTANLICIESISDIVNNHRSRTATAIYGDCLEAVVHVDEVNPINGIISMSPNPVSEEATIILSRFVHHPLQLSIHDNTGRLVRVIKVPENINTLTENFSDLAKGVYTIRGQDEGMLTNVIRFTKL